MNKTLKILLTTIVLTILYYIVASLFLSNFELHSFNQFQDNKVKTEEFLYSKNDNDVVLLGSSLSFRLKEDSISDNCFNLGLGGFSAYDGFEILKRSNSLPKVILVESNYLSRQMDEEYIKSTFEPYFIYKIKSYFPLLREKYNPILIIESLIKQNINKHKKTNDQSIQQEKEPSDNLIQQAIKSNSIKYSNEYWENKQNELKEYITYFTEKGCKIKFVTIPMQKEVENSSLQMITKDKIDFLNIPIVTDSTGKYSTTDGLHLNQESALKFSKYIAKNINF